MTSQELHAALAELRLAEGRDHPALALHWPDPDQRATADAVLDWAMERLAFRESPPASAAIDSAGPLPAITATGIGTSKAWTVLRDRVLTTAFPTDHPRYLAFVGGAASVSSVLADMAVSAAGVYAGSQLEAGAVVQAERAAVRWLADLVGLPAQAHGAFVSGGSMANLSALVVARNAGRRRRTGPPDIIIAGATAHSSITSAAAVMGCRVVVVGEPDQPLRATDIRKALRRTRARKVVAVAAAAGATNTGAIDDLAGIAQVCAERGVWLHVDAAYGGAALLCERTRGAFSGIELADSVTIDPHKWLFTPFDCGAVLYREPGLARSTHAQTAAYLDPVSEAGQDNPSDYALHLSRRARGLPLWMSLVAHGSAAYRRSIEACLDVADYAATRIRTSDLFTLAAEPSLSVVVFRRRGWTAGDYATWSERARRAGLGLITPTTVSGEPALRFCFVNPQTSVADVDLVLADLGISV